jgi:ankyrin repeat protein
VCVCVCVFPDVCVSGLKAARKLLHAGADPDRVAGCTGSSALHDAVVGGHPEVITLLLEHHAKQTVRDDRGMTPLHVCCLNNDVVAARILLAHKGARKVLLLLDKKGRTPRMVCSKGYMQQIIEREYFC